MSPRLQKLAATLARKSAVHEKACERDRAAWKAARRSGKNVRAAYAEVCTAADAVAAQAEAENLCRHCLADLASPEAAGGEGGWCGPCAEVPF